MTADRVTILFGPPGTGKTTALLKEVSETLRSGVPPERIAYFAFTRKAANEANERASQQFGMSDKELIWFRTLHSAAFKMLGLSTSEVMQQANYTELARAIGHVSFAHQYDENTERVPMGGANGDELLGMYTRARSRNISVEDEWDLTRDKRVSLWEAKTFAKVFDEYKRCYNLLDFSDFLDEVHGDIPLDLLIIDEAQDLTRQQWDFAKRIGRSAKRVIIAGDDDQAIFQWAGADLRYFLELPGRRKVLPISYRLPSSVWNKCNSIISPVVRRQKKNWLPRPEPGLVEYSSGMLENSKLWTQGEWLLLARLRYQTELLVQQCRERGVVYKHNGVWSHSAPPIRAVVNYEKLRRGEAINWRTAAALADYVPGITVPRQDYVEWHDIRWPFADRPDWMHALKLMSVEDEMYLRLLKSNGESLSNPGRVVISTIHGVKGGEADNVYLMTDTSKRIVTNTLDDAYANIDDVDQEKRVWYVGASRARNNLFIAEPTGRRHVLI